MVDNSKEALRLLFFDPSDRDFPPARERLPNSWELVISQLKTLVELADQRPVFLIGPFGSGKSTLISSMIKSRQSPFDKGRRIHRVSMHAAANTDQGLLSLMHPAQKRVVFLIAFACIALGWTLAGLIPFLLFPGSATISLALLGILFSTVLIFAGGNRIRLIYLLYCYFPQIRFGADSDILVIEDFDRSPMSDAEMLTNLVSRPISSAPCLVVLGYSNPDQRSKLIEIALKLNGRIVSMVTDEVALAKIGKSVDEAFSFRGDRWISEFSAREIVAVCEAGNRQLKGMPNVEVLLCYFSFFVTAIGEKYGLTRESIEAFGGQLGYGKIHPKASKAVGALSRDIDWEEVKKVYSYAPNAANWDEVLMMRVIRREEPFQNVMVLHVH